MKIPNEGLSEGDLFATLASYREGDVNWRAGKIFGYVYDPGEDVERIGKRAYTTFLSENALDPTVYPSLLRLEVEVVSMARHHLNGDDAVVGNFTSGGTESILLAVKTARDAALSRRPELQRPKMLLPITAHAAFHKAAKYFGLEVVPIPVGDDYRADVVAARRLIDADTVLVVGSAPQYAHGVVDPIEELAALAQENGAYMHVDACIGGWLLPYFERLGADVPRFDFRVPGVTSISMDLHKYAYCPKGASVILCRDEGLRRHQIFSTSQWAGYSVVNCTVQSTKSGGPLAAAWAVLRYVGDAGYLQYAQTLRQTTSALVEGIAAHPDLEIMGSPVMSLVAFTSKTVNVFHVVDEMKERGWLLGVQLAFDSIPENVHLTVQPGNAEHVDGFLTDLRQSVDAARALPSSDLAGQVKLAFSNMAPSDITAEVFDQLVGMAGLTGGLPGRMAEVNEVLNALPPELSERLLAEYVNRLFTERGLAP